LPIPLNLTQSHDNTTETLSVLLVKNQWGDWITIQKRFLQKQPLGTITSHVKSAFSLSVQDVTGFKSNELNSTQSDSTFTFQTRTSQQRRLLSFNFVYERSTEI